MGVGSRVRLKGFGVLIRTFSAKKALKAIIEEEKKSMKRAVLLLRTEVINYIDSEKHGIPNSPLTALIKGSSKPLVDHGDLRLGITTAVGSSRNKVHGAVGVLKKGKNKRGRALANVAAALHEGFTVRVTPEVRKAVFAEMRKRRGSSVKAGEGKGSGAKVWVVRGRPFIREPLEQNEDRIIELLGRGIRTTLRGLGKK